MRWICSTQENLMVFALLQVTAISLALQCVYAKRALPFSGSGKRKLQRLFVMPAISFCLPKFCARVPQMNPLLSPKKQRMITLPPNHSLLLKLQK
ncbi:protein of unknown function [Sterolibacterium denitrificans]|uniref:Uncharacterized protein n=1 Tax=Sterolibacterium denitrificans TaxID=157592 RepID=A0A7Z7MU73_9PROT|nr:protein of unknown function [Sterolibacterium denitrificans]